MADLVRHGVQVKRVGVNMIDVHPEIRARLRAGFADLRLQGRVRVSSGARTYDQQRGLYALYRAGKGNLAADPARRWGNGRVGSAHQVQPAGGYSVAGLDNSDPWAYAVDVGFYGTVNTAALATVLGEHGLYPNVKGEWWHFVPRPNHRIYAICGRGSTGQAVKEVQQILRGADYDVTVDGLYGPGTQAAVEQFQTDHGLTVHGDWDTRTADKAKTAAKRRPAHTLNVTAEQQAVAHLKHAIRLIKADG